MAAPVFQVLLQVARLADAELMSIVIDLVATALGNYKWADSEMPLIEQVRAFGSFAGHQ
jgi:hypothetical protein